MATSQLSFGLFSTKIQSIDKFPSANSLFRFITYIASSWPLKTREAAPIAAIAPPPTTSGFTPARSFATYNDDVSSSFKSNESSINCLSSDDEIHGKKFDDDDEEVIPSC